jgi:hypothetical protein
MENLIHPDYSLPLLEERPALSIPGWIRLTALLFKGIIRWWFIRRHTRLESQMITLLGTIKNCRDRQELETLIGKPLYALSGCLYRLGDTIPDRVEIYNHSEFQIEVFFEEENHTSSSIYLFPGAWSIATAIG